MFKWSDFDKITLPLMFVFIMASSIFFHFLLKNKSEKIKQIPLHIVTIFLILLEISKQIYFLAKGIYTKNTLPIHFCSLIVVIFAFSQFLPKRFSKWLDIPSVVFPIIVILLVLIHPSSMIGNSSQTMFNNFPSFHAFYFHFLVMLYPVLKLSLKRFDLKVKYYLIILGCLAFYSSYAIPLAFKLNNNYLNILHSYFYPLEQFRLSCGQILYDIVLFLIGNFVSVGVYFIWYGINKLINKRRKENA